MNAALSASRKQLCTFACLILVSFVPICRGDTQTPPSGPCLPNIPEAVRDGRNYNHTKVFGSGVEPEVPLNTTTCFMISPRDKKSQRMDKGCAPPSTSWVVHVVSKDGTIHMRAATQHLQHEGFHMACYKVYEPGEYVVSVFLSALDAAASLSSRSLPPQQFPTTLIQNFHVFAKAEHPKEYASQLAQFFASQPVCTTEPLQLWRGSEGLWMGTEWHPYACRLHRFTPSEARQCLRGKRVLLTGDTQQLSLYATAIAFLSSTDRCTFANSFGSNPGSFLNVRCDKARMNGATPWLPSSEDEHKIAVHRTEFRNGIAATYYGTALNGFAVARIPQFMQRSNRGARSSTRRRLLEEAGKVRGGVGGGHGGTGDRQDEGKKQGTERGESTGESQGALGWVNDPFDEQVGSPKGAPNEPLDELSSGVTGGEKGAMDLRPGTADGSVLHRDRKRDLRLRSKRLKAGEIVLVFVAHTNASELLFKDWMVDTRRPGALANDFAPFDYVLASSGVRDLPAFDSASDYAAALDLEFISSLRLAISGSAKDVISWIGTQSVQQSLLKDRALPLTNVARVTAFDEATRSVARTWGIPFLHTEPLSQSRPDLSAGAAHYSWPVSRAILELWLSSICPVHSPQVASSCDH